MRATAAEVTVHALDDLGTRGMRSVQQQAVSVHDHAGGAVAALQGIVVDEGLLQRMQLAVRGQALDRGDVLARHVLCFERAGAYGLLLDDDGARAAQTLTTSILGAGQSQVVAEHRKQRAMGIDPNAHSLAVEIEADGFVHVAPGVIVDFRLPIAD